MTISKPIVDVTLYLKGDKLNPHLTSVSLGVEGTTMRAKGEMYSIGAGRQASSKIGVWALESNSDDDSLSGKISWLKIALANATSRPFEIPGVENIDLDIYIELGRNANGDGAYASTMQAEDIKWINEIGAFVSINLSFCRD